ncbi:MAG TPA: MarR family transcriptional regulator [Thermoleophilaceae bacterium]|jgi:DNA-binding MarR family transcriptional regulator
MDASVKEAGSETQSPPVPDNLNWLLAWVSHALATETTAALERFSVTPRAHCVLSSAMKGEYTQTELATAIGLDKTTMVVTIDELEAHGLAERVPSENDRRARVIRVTPAGRKLVARGEREVARIEAEVLGSLPERQRGVLVDALSALAQDRLSEPVACAHAPRRRAPRG